MSSHIDMAEEDEPEQYALGAVLLNAAVQQHCLEHIYGECTNGERS